MIQTNTLFWIVDNYGARTAKCIYIKRRILGRVGEEVLVTIRKYNKKKKVKKGQLFFRCYC